MSIVDKLAVIETANQSWNCVHDAARPFAVAIMGRKGSVLEIVSRHTTMRGAQISAGLLSKEGKVKMTQVVDKEPQKFGAVADTTEQEDSQ